jgi:bile acid:Na+ symporter, BASS family
MVAIDLLLPVALAITMFSLGLGLVVDDFLVVARRPKAFAIGAVLQIVVLPASAFGLAVALELPPELGLGMVILSLCPGGPTSNLFTRFANGDVALSISLTAVITLTSVATIPVMVALAADHFQVAGAANVDVSRLALLLLATTIIPVLAAMVLRERNSVLAARIEPAFIKLTLLILVIFVATALATNWTFFLENVGKVALACLALLALMLAAGLAAGRLFAISRAQATTLSIDTAIQNGAMGIAISAMLGADGVGTSPTMIPAGVYGLLMYAAIIPFVLWRRSGTK